MCSFYNAGQSATLHKSIENIRLLGVLEVGISSSVLASLPVLGVYYLPTRGVIKFITMDSFKEYNAKFVLL